MFKIIKTKKYDFLQSSLECANTNIKNYQSEIDTQRKLIELHEKFLFDVHLFAKNTDNEKLFDIIVKHDSLVLSENRKEYFDLLCIAEAKNLQLQEVIEDLRRQLKQPSLFTDEQLMKSEITFLKGENERLKKDLNKIYSCACCDE